MNLITESLIDDARGLRTGARSPVVWAALQRRWRAGSVALLCLGATVGVALFVGDVTPIATWMVWKVALIWLWALAFGAGCLGLGSALCRWALRGQAEIPPLERIALALAVGAAAFGAAMYAAGALRLFRPALAVVLPVLGIAAGLGRSPATRLFAGRPARLSLGAGDLAALALGALSIGLIYLHVLNPDALSYDARWTHLVIAQDYAREGHLVGFPAEWAKNFPHLASLFYAWAFLVPGLSPSLRVLLVMHVELLFLIGTLISVAALARWFTAHAGAPAQQARTAWVTFFLFPSIFVYDSNLGGSADHIAALFVLPIFLALVRGSERVSPRLGALAGALAGAALITKYQTVYVILPATLLGALRLAQAVRRSRRDPAREDARRTRALATAGAFVLAAIATSSPFFLENAVFHHNPIYPFAQGVFSATTPALPDGDFLVSSVLVPSDLRHSRLGLGRKLLEALGAVFSFSFQPHASYQGQRPYFGFLFTLLSPLVLVLPGARRLRLGALVAGGSLFVWAMTYVIDRNLQIILPLLAAVTAGVIIEIWRLGWVARIGLAPLLLLQLAWGGDLMFQGYLSAVLDHMRGGMEGRVLASEVAERQEIARLVPRGGKVLLHGEHPTLGIDREVLSDEMGFQGLIDYRTLRSAREVHDRFRALGLTHVVWLEQNEPGNHLQRAIVFNALVKRLSAQTFGRYSVVALSSVPPPATPPYRVLVLGWSEYPDGIYDIDVLARCQMRPPERCVPPRPAVALTGPATVATLEAGVDAVVIAASRQPDPTVTAMLAERFISAWPGGGYHLYLPR